MSLKLQKILASDVKNAIWRESQVPLPFSVVNLFEGFEMSNTPNSNAYGFSASLSGLYTQTPETIHAKFSTTVGVGTMFNRL